MRLTQIKLAGFKSFVEPTQVPIPGRLVGVVGPNGCGKSNIIDAVRWVLGESKASELRGESMVDVIFNGSTQRKPAARASVELVFDNALGRAGGPWSRFAEISVRRVLTRDGGSSYFVNAQQVRRKDVHDIFLGTGLGARGYAIIGQGMISRIIEARPEELRVFLEEAAGVSRYKERRRETEGRLADTRDNLTRLEDIRQELQQQLERLQGQAEVASRYHALQQEGERKQHALWRLRMREAEAELVRVDVEHAQAVRDLERSRAQAGTLALRVEQCREQEREATTRLQSVQAQFYRSASEVGQLEAEIRFVVESRDRLRSQLERTSQQVAHWRGEHARLGEELTELQLRDQEAHVTLEESAARLELLHEQQTSLQLAATQAEQALSQVRDAVAEIERRIALSAATQRDSERQQQSLQLRQERLVSERSGLGLPDVHALEAMELLWQEATALAEAAVERVEALERELQAASAARDTALAEAQRDLDNMRQTDARLGALVRIQQDVQAADALRPWLDAQGLGDRQPLWRSITVEPGWELAVEAILQERLHALGVSDLGLIRGFEKSPPPARLTFYGSADPFATPGVHQSGVWAQTALLSLVRTERPELQRVLSFWLSGVYVAQELSQALLVREQLSDGLVLVTPAGHRIDRMSVRFHAADSEQSGMLARAQEIEQLRKALRAEQLLSDASEARKVKAQSRVQELHSALPAARQEASRASQALQSAATERARLAQQRVQGEGRLQRIEEELHELSESLAEEVARLELAQEDFAAADEQLAQAQEAYEQRKDDLRHARAALEVWQESLRRAEREHQAAEHQLRGLQQRQEEVRRLLRQADEQAGEAGAQIARLEQDLAALDDEASRAGLEEAMARKAEAEALLGVAREALDEAQQQLRALDEQRLTLDRGLDPLRERITQLQLRRQAVELQQAQFEEQLKLAAVDLAMLDTDLAQLPPVWLKASWLQSEVQRVQQEIISLGAVNLAALDELSAAQERSAFLDRQQTDLQTAIQTLEDAIRKIDRETRSLLQETFDLVNRHFGELFPSLFGGGEARLIMTGDEILDAGVQVMAQPPGKRNSTIHLLSGGEKALTATALVFAMFRLNPAPFCLLDEVDAPLDDANTERFAKLVQRMSDQTQFLFISHNKIAMEMAEQLIGVTMQEQGVSRIVAVDMESALKLATEAA